MHICAYKLLGQQVGDGSQKRGTGLWGSCPHVGFHTPKGFVGGQLIVFWSSGVWGHSICSLLTILPCGMWCVGSLYDGAWILDFLRFTIVRILYAIQRKVYWDTSIFSSYNIPISSTYSSPHICLSLLGCKHQCVHFALLYLKCYVIPLDNLYTCQVNDFI